MAYGMLWEGAAQTFFIRFTRVVAAQPARSESEPARRPRSQSRLWGRQSDFPKFGPDAPIVSITFPRGFWKLTKSVRFSSQFNNLQSKANEDYEEDEPLSAQSTRR
jgi:hypothetical protein